MLYLPGDFVIRQAEEGDCLFFINKGVVEVQMSRYELVDAKHQDNHQEKGMPKRFSINQDQGSFGTLNNVGSDKIKVSDGIASDKNDVQSMYSQNELRDKENTLENNNQNS